MRRATGWIALGALPLALGIGGCTDRRQIFDNAMLATVSDLRSGDMDGASASLATARSHADDDLQRSKVSDLEMLISGAEAYCRGERTQASMTWSDIKSPEIRRGINASQVSLGVSLAQSNAIGGSR
jgi:hypothetical protein